MQTRTGSTSSSKWQLAIGHWQFFAWQGWNLRVPANWNAIKLEGDRDKGFALLADLDSARLGLRWVATKSSDVRRAVESAMRAEVGELAAKEAIDVEMTAGDWPVSKLYIEPDPPGRDVWIGYSAASKRIVEVIYHATRRDRVLHDRILPALADTPADQPTRWAVLDLSCVSAPGFTLASQQLSAGDLRLGFVSGRRNLLIRQIGPAKLALGRMPLEKWLSQHPLKHGGMYRCVESKDLGDGGLQKIFVRRRRFVLYRHVPALIVARSLQDLDADRIVIVESDDEATAAAVLRDVGWARSTRSGRRVAPE